jgi:hypothetical protein
LNGDQRSKIEHWNQNRSIFDSPLNTEILEENDRVRCPEWDLFEERFPAFFERKIVNTIFDPASATISRQSFVYAFSKQ